MSTQRIGAAVSDVSQNNSICFLEKTAKGKGSSCLLCPTPLLLETRVLGRVRGLLFSKPREGILMLAPCSDVHTVGMKHCLDIAFVDRRGCIMESHRCVAPFRRLKKRGAVGVLERFSTCSSSWFEAGDQIGLVCVKGVKQ